MKVVDSRLPLAHRPQWVAAPEQKVPGVEADADRRQLEHLLDLPGRFDAGPRLVVERRLIPALATQRGSHLDALGELLPHFVIEAKGAVLRCLARSRPSQLAPDVGQGRLRLQPILAPGGVEDIEQRTQLAQRDRHLVELAERELEKSA